MVLKNRSPAYVAGFLNTLDKLGQGIRAQDVINRLKIGTGPLWGAAGVRLGLAGARSMHRAMGSSASWPILLAGILAGYGGLKLMKRVYEGNKKEEDAALESLLMQNRFPPSVVREGVRAVWPRSMGAAPLPKSPTGRGQGG